MLLSRKNTIDSHAGAKCGKGSGLQKISSVLHNMYFKSYLIDKWEFTSVALEQGFRSNDIILGTDYTDFSEAPQ